MKDLGHTGDLYIYIYVTGHTLPGRQNWTFASNSRCFYFKKATQTTALNNWVNLLYIQKGLFQSCGRKINPFNLKAVMLDIPGPSMLYWECTLAQARLSLCTKISWNYMCGSRGGDMGSGPPPWTITKIKGFLAIQVRIPWKIATAKPAFNVGHSLACKRSVSLAGRWWPA